MKMQKTLQFKIIEANKSKELSINTTIRQYRKCINFYLHEIAKRTSISNIYYMARKIFNLPSALVQTARDIAKEQYLSWKNNDDNPHFPHFNGLIPIRFDRRTISFKKIDNHFEWWANISTINGRVMVPIASCEDNLGKLNGKFKAVQLVYKNGSYYLNVVFEDEKHIPSEAEFEHFVGVDLGVNNLATIVVQDRNGNVLESKFFSGRQASEKRRRFMELRRRLGEKKLWKEIKKTKDRERNYIKDLDHKISTEIIGIASKYPNCCIVMEKLKGIREKIKYSKNLNRKIHSWAFKELQDFIEYKAHGNSIAVRRVFPAYTSQVCRNCFGKMERSPHSRVVCQTCKKEYNADWLAASNITRRLFGYMSNNPGFSGSSPEHGNVDSEGVTGSSFGESMGMVAQLRGSSP